MLKHYFVIQYEFRIQDIESRHSFNIFTDSPLLGKLFTVLLPWCADVCHHFDAACLYFDETVTEFSVTSNC